MTKLYRDRVCVFHIGFSKDLLMLCTGLKRYSCYDCSGIYDPKQDQRAIDSIVMQCFMV